MHPSTSLFRVSGLRGTRLAIAGLAVTLSACRAIAPAAETLQQVEERRFAAMVAQDLAALEPMLAEELNYTHSTGAVENKTQFLEQIRSGRMRYEAMQIEQLDVRTYGNLALLTGRVAARVRLDDQPMALVLRYTDAYVQRDGRWQLVAWQSTRVP